jgi:serine/threonine-protein kinase
MDNLEALQEAFEHAVSLDPEAQDEYLLQLKESDPNLHQQLVQLLENDGQSDTFVQQPIHATLQSSQVKEDYWLGKSFGVFTATQKIASGGMGSVYLAQRCDAEFEQQVAIKLLSTHIRDAYTITRFNQERQILAQLQHPNIAKLYDGGTTEDGLPFLVMEFIDGETLDQYCHKNALSLKARLELMVDICSAVDYLHKHFIVHRDIKPSNIMVDADGTPKLLDFGIAKMLSEDLDKTQTEAAMLTPGYASPEQLRGESVATTSDVYSLGLVLYKLLCGTTPVSQSSHSLAQVLDVALKGDMPRPSQFIKRLSSNSFEFDVSLRSKLFAGDLDNIVLKAVDASADQRYSRASDLATDIRNYLYKRPVSARPHSWSYVVLRFYQRNLAASSIASLSLIALCIFSITVAYQSRVITQKSIEVAKQQQTSRATADFLVDIFKMSEPVESLGNLVTAREILDRGAKRIHTEFPESGTVRTELLHSIGRAYASLGVVSQAEPLLVEAKIQRQKMLGDKNPSLIESFNQLALVKEQTGEIDQREALLREALALARHHQLADPNRVVQQLLSLANVLREKANYDEVFSVLKEAQILLQQLSNRNDILNIDIQQQWVMLYVEQGDFNQALPLVEQTYLLAQTIFGEMHPKLAEILSLWTYAQIWARNYEVGQPIAEQALNKARLLYGELHYSTIVAYYDLGTIYHKLGQFDLAASMLENVKTLGEQALNKDHPLVANAYNNLGNLYSEMGLLDDSEEHYLKSIDINRRIFGGNDIETLTSEANLATMFIRNGRFDEALPLVESTLQQRLAIFPENHPHSLASLSNAGELYAKQGKLEQAFSMFSRGLSASKIVYGESHPVTAVNYARVAWISMLKGDLINAKSMAKIGYDSINKVAETRPKHLAKIYSIYGEILARIGESQAAIPLLEKAINNLSVNHQGNPILLAHTQNVLNGLKPE